MSPCEVKHMLRTHSPLQVSLQIYTEESVVLASCPSTHHKSGWSCGLKHAVILLSSSVWIRGRMTGSSPAAGSELLHNNVGESQETHTPFITSAFLVSFLPPQFPNDLGKSSTILFICSLTRESITGANVGEIQQATSHTHIPAYSLVAADLPVGQ